MVDLTLLLIGNIDIVEFSVHYYVSVSFGVCSNVCCFSRLFHPRCFHDHLLASYYLLHMYITNGLFVIYFNYHLIS